MEVKKRIRYWWRRLRRKHSYSQHFLHTCWCQEDEKKQWDAGQAFAYGMLQVDLVLNRRKFGDNRKFIGDDVMGVLNNKENKNG